MEFLAWLLVLFLIIIFFGTAAYASFRAAPWLPVRTKDQMRISQTLRGRKGTFLELGAGDGRVLVRLARETGMTGIGFEISLIPFIAARIRILASGVKGKVKVQFKDFFDQDFSHADAIFCFLTPPAMKKLKVKFEREVRPGTRIVSYSFSVPDWTPTLVDRQGGGIPIFIYDR